MHIYNRKWTNTAFVLTARDIPAPTHSSPPDIGPQPTTDIHAMYSYYPFEADLSFMSEQDVDFLDSQGCFRIPGRQAVDQFIRVISSTSIQPAAPGKCIQQVVVEVTCF